MINFVQLVIQADHTYMNTAGGAKGKLNSAEYRVTAGESAGTQ